MTLNNVSSILTQFLIRFEIAIWSHFSVLCAISGFKTSFFFYDLIPDHAPPGTWGNLVSLFLSSRANGKKKGISNCKFRIVPSVSRIETTISRSHPQPSRGRVFFFFFSCARRTHMQTHTPLCVDFHKLFPHNVISGNQLDGIFWDDDSSDESSLLSLTFFHTKGRERECREKEQEEEKRRSWQYADEFTTWRVGMMHKPDLWLLNKSVVLHSNS